MVPRREGRGRYQLALPQVQEFYCLVPFDKYDLDDLLQPYGKKVKSVKGSLRQKYIDEHQQ